jgi:hypothetical protein
MTATNDSTVVRAGETSTLELTVTNTTDRNLNGLVRVVPENTSHSAWISVHGDSAKNFAPGSTQKLAIKFDPPVKASPGKSKCRILVADERNPDEDFADITLEYEIKEPKEKLKFPILPVILAACGVVVIIAGVIWYFNRDREPIIAPDVVALHKVDKAYDRTVELGLTPIVKLKDNSGGEYGTIYKQEPVAGALMPNRELTIFILDGKKSDDGTRGKPPLRIIDHHELKLKMKTQWER